MNEYTYQQIPLGLTARFSRQITKEMEDSFRVLSGDENPLHQDDGFAAESGRFSGHVAFGMLTAALYSTLAGMYLPGRYSLIHSFDELSFPKPVYAGDTLTVTGEVSEKIDGLNLLILKAVIRNQNNKIVSRAKMKVLVTK